MDYMDQSVTCKQCGGETSQIIAGICHSCESSASDAARKAALAAKSDTNKALDILESFANPQHMTFSKEKAAFVLGVFRTLTVPVAERAAAPASVPKFKDHNVRQLVNDLRAIALKFHATQQLRSRIQDAVHQFLAAPEVAQPAAQGERAAPSEKAREMVERLRNEHKLESWNWDSLLEAADMIESLATPAPTAGEPSAEPDGLCNSALHAEPAWQHDADFAILLADAACCIESPQEVATSKKRALVKALIAIATVIQRDENGCAIQGGKEGAS